MLLIKFLLLIVFFLIPIYSKSLESNITVLMYHRFNSDKYLDTSISSEKFNEQINYLIENNIKILPLDNLIDILENENKISENLVFITIDDAYKSFYEFGFPILKKNKIPFSIFVSSKYISEDDKSDYVSWGMLKDMSENNGLILNHSTSHRSFLTLTTDELEKDVIQNQKKIEKNLGAQPKIFSYPYGESNIEIEKKIENLGYEIAFSQHSAPISYNENKFRLPRYALNDEFGDLERFKLILNSKPLLVSDLNYQDTTVKTENFKLSFKTHVSAKLINCFINNSGLIIKENDNKNVTLFIKNLQPNNRYRINCTYKDKNNQLFWFGKMIKRVY